MMEIKYKNELIKDIGENRYNHSIRVMNTALELAKKYNCDEEKTKVASILHDCGKLLDIDKLKTSEYFDIIEDIPINSNIQLFHGLLGARIAEKKYNIKDRDILNSIQYHTTGRENMSTLEKIIYIADYIEPERSFTDLEVIRKETYINLDKAVLLAMESTIKFLIEKKKIIGLQTIEARNYLLSVI